jgi:hypothetical protein
MLYAVGELRGDMTKPPSGSTHSKDQNLYILCPYFRVSNNSLVHFYHTITMIINMTLPSFLDRIKEKTEGSK